MKPKFTDSDRYKHGYRDSKHTDIRLTFKRIREEQKRIAEEAAVKVQPLKRAAK